MRGNHAKSLNWDTAQVEGGGETRLSPQVWCLLFTCLSESTPLMQYLLAPTTLGSVRAQQYPSGDFISPDASMKGLKKKNEDILKHYLLWITGYLNLTLEYFVLYYYYDDDLLLLLLLLFSWNKISWYSLGWPEAYYIDQAELELTEIYLLLSPDCWA